MEGLHLPMSQGSMDDIIHEGEGSSQMDNSTGESMSTQGARAIYEREARIIIDYSRLSDDHKDVRSYCKNFPAFFTRIKKPHGGVQKFGIIFSPICNIIFCVDSRKKSWDIRK